VEQHRNITLNLPRELLQQIERLAADRNTSVSAMMIEALKRLADEDRRYSAACKRSLAALQSARSLGTGGRRTWSRDELAQRLTTPVVYTTGSAFSGPGQPFWPAATNRIQFWLGK
jgi:predicted transcriptional regulator